MANQAADDRRRFVETVIDATENTLAALQLYDEKTQELLGGVLLMDMNDSHSIHVQRTLAMAPRVGAFIHSERVLLRDIQEELQRYLSEL